MPAQQRQAALQAVNDLASAGQWGNDERAQLQGTLGMVDPIDVEREMQTGVGNG